MFTQYWKPWWPSALLNLRTLGDTVPLSSLADIDEPRIGIVDDAFSQPVAFEASGVRLSHFKRAATNAEVCSQIFSVFETNDSETGAAPPLSGNYRVDRGRLRFVPLHPLRVGSKYRAVLHVRETLNSDRTLLGGSVYCDVTIPERRVVDNSQESSVKMAS